MTQFVMINGANLAYEICGPDGGLLMITLHGGRGMGTYIHFAFDSMSSIKPTSHKGITGKILKFTAS